MPPKRNVREQREHDRLRPRHAFYASAGFAGVLLVIFLLQPNFDWRTFAVYSRSASGLLGIVTAPRGLPIIWLGSGWVQGGRAMPAPSTRAPAD
ncbi:MAG: hypothetical protein LH491_01290 [Pseudoxanthomonas sp.]|nr:hypothetical protein [Pseudoxanthomonas sp.]